MIQLRNSASSGGTDILAPLVQAWLGRVQECKRHKQPFNDVAQQCMEFFSGSMGFMWNSAFTGKFMGGIRAPRFRITICKAFELVALYGPTLYWRNPVRIVKPRGGRHQVSMEALTGALGGDGAAMQVYQMLQQSVGQRQASHEIVSSLLSEYLNYTPGEQPQGLAWHASSAITEALVKGRGCLWPMPYSPPASNRVLTGCFYDSVDNLLIDPDATTLYDARYIIKQETKAVRDWEEEFGLPKGSLVGKGTHESAWKQGDSQANPDATAERRTGKLNDLMTCYKVWSKAGIGVHLDGPQQVYRPLADALDNSIGRYAYMVVAPNVNYPLNGHPDWMRTATDEEIVKRFSWPVPYWLDNRWPVVPIDFYNRPNDPWAIAPLAPGLGELTFINVMMSSLAAKIYNTSRILIAGSEALGDTIEQQIRTGDDLTYLKVPTHITKISEYLEMLKFPEVNGDVWQMIERTMYMFDRRTGITELMAGMTPGNKIARVAEDVRQRSEASQIRPEYMAARVEDALSVASEHEKLAARWFVEPQHLNGLFGPAEQFLWGQFINGVSPELVVREFEATVVANSSRKPDRAKDMESFQQLAQFFLPFLTQYSMSSADFQPVNGMIRRWGEATDNPVDDMLINPQAMQQMMQQQQEAQQAEAQAAQQQTQSQIEIAQQQHQMKMQQGMEQHAQKLQMTDEQHQLKLQQAAQNMQLNVTEDKVKRAQDAASFIQEMRQDVAEHAQAMEQEQETHSQKMRLAEKMAAVQAAVAKRKQSQKPKQSAGAR